MGILSSTAGDGQPIPRCYGEHLITGHVILNRDTTPRALLMLLGKGPWHSAVNVWYRGDKLLNSDFHFHPGTLSSGLTDIIQGEDSFYPGSGQTYSRRAYIAARIPDAYTSVEPQNLIGRYRCQLVADYDDRGRETETAGYSANPARIFADVWIKQAKLSPDRIDWATWYEWKTFCGTSIPWFDGVENRMIPRFEAHVKFTNSVEIVDVIQLLCRLSASTWQDTGTRLVFFPPDAQTAPFLFDSSILDTGSVRVYPVDLRQLPEFARVLFRDLDSEVLAPARYTARPNTPRLRRPRNGLADAQFDAMYYSQAMRLANFYLNRSRGTDRRAKFSAYGRSLGVLPGDFAKLSHRLTKGEVDVEILEASDLGTTTGKRSFLAAIKKTPIWYHDTDHEPKPTQIDVT